MSKKSVCAPSGPYLAPTPFPFHVQPKNPHLKQNQNSNTMSKKLHLLWYWSPSPSYLQGKKACICTKFQNFNTFKTSTIHFKPPSSFFKDRILEVSSPKNVLREKICFSVCRHGGSCSRLGLCFLVRMFAPLARLRPCQTDRARDRATAVYRFLVTTSLRKKWQPNEFGD